MKRHTWYSSLLRYTHTSCSNCRCSGTCLHKHSIPSSNTPLGVWCCWCRTLHNSLNRKQQSQAADIFVETYLTQHPLCFRQRQLCQLLILRDGSSHHYRGVTTLVISHISRSTHSDLGSSSFVNSWFSEIAATTNGVWPSLSFAFASAPACTQITCHTKSYSCEFTKLYSHLCTCHMKSYSCEFTK